MALKRFDEAIASIDRAVEVEPQNATFLLGKCLVLNVTGRVEEIDAAAERAVEAAGTDADLRVTVAGLLSDANRVDRARDLIQGLKSATLRDELTRLQLAEILIVTGDNVSAVSILRNIDLNRLTRSHRVVRSLLHLLADKLAGATQISEELLVTFLREYEKRIDQREANSDGSGLQSIDWLYMGVRRLLTRSELPVLDKLVLATLIDLQEMKIRRVDLSFFTDMWPKLDITKGLIQEPALSPEVS